MSESSRGPEDRLRSDLLQTTGLSPAALAQARMLESLAMRIVAGLSDFYVLALDEREWVLERAIGLARAQFPDAPEVTAGCEIWLALLRQRISTEQTPPPGPEPAP